MSNEYEVRAAEHATPEEMVKTLRQLAKWERIDGCVNEATTIEAMLDERDKLKADVERLRRACEYARGSMHACAGGCLTMGHSCSWCVVSAALAKTDPDHVADVGNKVEQEGTP